MKQKQKQNRKKCSIQTTIGKFKRQNGNENGNQQSINCEPVGKNGGHWHSKRQTVDKLGINDWKLYFYCAAKTAATQFNCNRIFSQWATAKITSINGKQNYIKNLRKKFIFPNFQFIQSFHFYSRLLIKYNNKNEPTINL